jgi:hypothetical protein
LAKFYLTEIVVEEILYVFLVETFAIVLGTGYSYQST